MKILIWIGIICLFLFWGSQDKNKIEYTEEEREETRIWYKKESAKCWEYFKGLPTGKLLSEAESLGENFKEEGYSLADKMISRCISLGGPKQLIIIDNMMGSDLDCTENPSFLGSCRHLLK